MRKWSELKLQKRCRISYNYSKYTGNKFEFRFRSMISEQIKSAFGNYTPFSGLSSWKFDLLKSQNSNEISDSYFCFKIFDYKLYLVSPNILSISTKILSIKNLIPKNSQWRTASIYPQHLYFYCQSVLKVLKIKRVLLKFFTV